MDLQVVEDINRTLLFDELIAGITIFKSSHQKEIVSKYS